MELLIGVRRQQHSEEIHNNGVPANVVDKYAGQTSDWLENTTLNIGIAIKKIIS